VAGYLNLQIHKPTDPTKLNEPKTTIFALLKDCYSDKLHVMPPARNDWNNQMRRFSKPSLQGVALAVALQMMTESVFLVLTRLTMTLPWALLCRTTHSLTLFNGG
jgi:hypothetical protein